MPHLAHRRATSCARSVAESFCAVQGAVDDTTNTTRPISVRMDMRLIYLLLFMSPQVLLYRYLWERLPNPTWLRQARIARAALTVAFVVFNVPWIFVAHRVLFSTVWAIGWSSRSRVPGSRGSSWDGPSSRWSCSISR